MSNRRPNPELGVPGTRPGEGVSRHGAQGDAAQRAAAPFAGTFPLYGSLGSQPMFLRDASHDAGMVSICAHRGGPAVFDADGWLVVEAWLPAQLT